MILTSKNHSDSGEETVDSKSSSDTTVVRTHLSGYDLLLHPELNKGTAFTEEERSEFALHGLLPPHIGTLENQRERRMKALNDQPNSFAKYRLMRDLQDNDEVLFYSLIKHNVEELLPVVYTPAVGEGCQRLSEIWRKPRGLFISYPNRHLMDQMLGHVRYEEIRCIVVSDGERILGLGDQGAGGMGIPIGKMALYTALGGIPPQHCLPILLDVGTDNEELLNNPIYIGWQHRRVRGQEYDDFIEAFVSAVQRRWPHILLQWEDFAGENALRILGRYRDRLCTFNDDIQGTAAVTTGALFAAVHATGVPLRDQRIAMFGSGSAGVGIIALLINAMQEQGLSEAEARQRIYAFNRHGLIVEGDPNLRASQVPLARRKGEVAGWKLSAEGPISLRDTVENAKITVLVGVSAKAGAFTEEIVRTMARNSKRPVIFPLSNPTSVSEARPEDLFRWTDGKALVGTGSPFPPVEVNGREVRISQINNSFIFPGLALGILVSRAGRVTDGMMMAAAKALAAQSPAASDATAPLLPRVAESRRVALAVAEAVARQAVQEGISDSGENSSISDAIRAYVWEPVYHPYQRVYLHAGRIQENPDFAI
jgi:malate dehydrogenase (oxaloacetate-decarboxylating)